MGFYYDMDGNLNVYHMNVSAQKNITSTMR